MKRGQSMPMNVIIIAALVLLVLIVIALIFGGRIQNFGKGTKSCTAIGGHCELSCDSTAGQKKLGDSLEYPDCSSVCCYDTR